MLPSQIYQQHCLDVTGDHVALGDVRLMLKVVLLDILDEPQMLTHNHAPTHTHTHMQDCFQDLVPASRTWLFKKSQGVHRAIEFPTLWKGRLKISGLATRFALELDD